MKHTLLIFSLLFFSFLAAKSQSKVVSRFMEQYRCVAHQNINGKLMPVEKWEDKETLRYMVVGKMVHTTDKSLKKYLEQIGQLTGITFSETHDKKEADIILFFGELSAYFRFVNSNAPVNITSNFDNWCNRRYTQNYQLINGTLCVDTEKGKTPERCRYNVRRGILKMMGFWGESSDRSSIFYKYNTRENLRPSKNDMKIIKLHYNSDIKAGMSAPETSEVLYNKIDLESFLKGKL